MPRAMLTPDNTPRGKPGDCEEIPISNKLLAKVGSSYGANPAAVERANNIVEQMKADYESGLTAELENL